MKEELQNKIADYSKLAESGKQLFVILFYMIYIINK